MPIKSWTDPDGRTFTWGYKKPGPYRAARFAAAFDAVNLPRVPKVSSWLSKAKPELGQMDLNDTLGDCVIAFGGHTEGIWTGWDGGGIKIATAPQLTAQYSAIGGYVEGNPSTDQGCDPITALNYWKAHGLPAGTAVSSWFNVDGGKQAELCGCTDLFGATMVCVDLPGSALPQNVPDLQNWAWWPFTGAPNPSDGHCVAMIGYDLNVPVPYALISTWGMWLRVRLDEIVKYAKAPAGGLCAGMISQAWMVANTGKSPSGFDIAQLQADSAAF